MARAAAGKAQQSGMQPTQPQTALVHSFGSVPPAPVLVGGFGGDPVPPVVGPHNSGLTPVTQPQVSSPEAAPPRAGKEVQPDASWPQHPRTQFNR